MCSSLSRWTFRTLSQQTYPTPLRPGLYCRHPLSCKAADRTVRLLRGDRVSDVGAAGNACRTRIGGAGATWACKNCDLAKFPGLEWACQYGFPSAIFRDRKDPGRCDRRISQPRRKPGITIGVSIAPSRLCITPEGSLVAGLVLGLYLSHAAQRLRRGGLTPGVRCTCERSSNSHPDDPSAGWGPWKPKFHRTRGKVHPMDTCLTPVGRRYLRNLRSQSTKAQTTRKANGSQ